MGDDIIYMVDLDGTGSMHPALKGDPGAVAYHRGEGGMTEHDLELYRRIIAEKDAHIKALEDAIRYVTYREPSGSIRVGFYEYHDLSLDRPIFSEVHA